MKTNKLLLIAAFFGGILIISSCKKNITLTPTSGATIDGYFKNQKDITSTLAGIYSAFQEEMTGAGAATDESYGGRYHYWGEVRSDNFTSSTFSTNSSVEMATNGLSFVNSAADWAGLYRVIGRANVAIKYFPQVGQYDPNVTPTITNNSLAQAYAMRAESYFYIVRVWKNAPVWTEPYLDITQPGSKGVTDGNKIIDSVIIPDLQKAYNLIQKQQTPVVWNIGEAAICAILGDVYMWRAGIPGLGSNTDYTNALIWYNNIFKAKNPAGATYTSTGSQLETGANWKNLFLTPASEAEDIWSIYWDYNDNGCACIPISIQLSNNPVTVDPFFQANWKKSYKTDVRVAKTIDTLAGLNHQNLVYKFLPLNPTATGITPVATNANYNVYLTMNRLGDVYLSMAEAYAMTNDLPNALTYLNLVYKRARVAPAVLTIPTGTYTTSASMEDAILAERQLELFGEGKRWFDLVRTNRVHQIMDPILNLRNGTRVTNPDGSITITPLTTGFAGAPDRYYWPVSQSALNNNKLLKQNAGY
jgi:TPR repeat protein